MSRKCEICGRTLRTGRKYCYEHRSLGKGRQNNRSDSNPLLAWMILSVIVGFVIIKILERFIALIKKEWIITLLICFVVLSFEIYRMKKTNFQIFKFESGIILAISAIFIILSTKVEWLVWPVTIIVLVFNATTVIKIIVEEKKLKKESN